MEERVWTRARLIGCGCLLTLAIGLACTGTTCHQLFGQVIVTDPVRVESMADRILPGAAPPNGYRGYYASRLGPIEYAHMKHPDGLGMRIHILGQRRKSEISEQRWKEFSRHHSAFPGRWGEETSSEASEQMVDGRKVLARRFQTADEELGFRFQLLTRDRMVLLTFVGLEGQFDERMMRSFLYRLDLDRAPRQAAIGGIPLWILGLFAVLGSALLTVGFYIVTELRVERGVDEEEGSFEL